VTPELLIGALAMWALGAAIDVACGSSHRLVRQLPYLAGALGCVAITIAGVHLDLGRPSTNEFGASLGTGPIVIQLDSLAGLFLTLIGGLGVAVSCCAVSWSRYGHRVARRSVAASYLLLLAAVTVVLIAGDVFTFLFAWELVTLAFFVLVGARRRDQPGSSASWLALNVGKLGGAALLFGMLLLATAAKSTDFAAWHDLSSSPARAAGYALLIVGFAAKVGVVPLQVWLPRSYSDAPGPLRAVMAGVAVNVGFYGLWRFMGVLGPPPVWIAVAVLVVGGLSALHGVTFAAVQARLTRVVAYSSIENSGLILVGYGVALAGLVSGQDGVVAIGLLAATLQVLAHAVAKSTLFAAGAFIEDATSSDELEDIRGVSKTMPWTAAAFGAGSVTLAGLPPTIGFVSEWFLLEALLQEFRLHSLPLRLAMAFAGALVALSIGIAMLCFIRLVGFTLLGRKGVRESSAGKNDSPGLSRPALVAIGALCFVLAAAAPWIIRYIAWGIAPVVSPSVTLGALKSRWVLQPVFANFSILSPTWLYVVLPTATVVVVLVTLAFSRGRVFKTRRVPAWRSATAGVDGPDAYTPFGFANALRHVLANVLGSKRTRVVVPTLGSERPGASHIEVETEVVEPVETYMVRPLATAWLRLSSVARRLQSGRLEAYVAYMLTTLIILLVIVASMR
jgi:hydrogenase-4 component B